MNTWFLRRVLTSTGRLTRSVVLIAGLLLPGVAAHGGNDGIRIKTDWPAYSGQGGRWLENSGVELRDDISQARLVWESEEQGVGYGKTTSGGFGRFLRSHPHLGPSGAASPIVADGVLILTYYALTGDVIDEALFERNGADPELRHRHRIDADDVVLAMDTATGRTKWKQTFPGGLNMPMGKRDGWGITPTAADGRVFTIGTTGRVRALDLNTGQLLWEGTVGPRHESLAAEREKALTTKTLNTKNSAWGQLLVVGNVVVAPDLSNGLIGFDPATGRQLWHQRQTLTSGSNMPVPIRMGGNDYVAVVNRNGQLRAIEVATGRIAWTVELKSMHLGQMGATDDLLLVFEPKPGLEQSEPASVGVLAGYTFNEQGATRRWVQNDLTLHLRKDSGAFLRPVVDDKGIVYMLERSNEPQRLRRLTLLNAADGRILHREDDFSDSTLHVWGDKLVTVSDIGHRPRGANAEIWRLYSRDPSNFRRIGNGWHVNGHPQVHTATGGYEIPLFDAFADGFLFARTVEGIRCYDLRKSAGDKIIEQAMSRIAADDHDARIEAMLALQRHEDADVRAGLMRLAASYDAGSEPRIARLFSHGLTDDHVVVQRAALTGLRRTASVPAPLLPKIAQLIASDGSPEQAENARLAIELYLLAAPEGQLPEARPAGWEERLIDALAAPSEVAYRAVSAIRAMGDETALRIFIAVLEGDNALSGIRACNGLGAMGAAARPALPAIEAAKEKWAGASAFVRSADETIDTLRHAR